MFNPKDYRIIDLTMPFRAGMPGYTFETTHTVEKEGWNARTLHLYSHAGTHMDAPHHFGVSSATIDEFSATQLVGKAWVAHIPIQDTQQLLEVSDLGEVQDHLQPGDSLLLHTDWSQLVGKPSYRDELPRISKGLAEWCVAKRVRMLGVEPPSVADVNNLPEVTEIHQILLGGNVIIIEGLTKLNQIRAASVMLVALPLKIKGGDGAPARVIAFEKK